MTKVRRTIVIAPASSSSLLSLSSSSASSSVDKNFNLGHNLWTANDRTFIFHMCIPCDKTSRNTIIFDLATLTLKFDLLFKNFNLGHNFQTRRARAFILHMCIPCDKTFHIIPYF